MWVARQGDFSRPQELKLTCSALGGLLNATDPALDSMTTAYVTYTLCCACTHTCTSPCCLCPSMHL